MTHGTETIEAGVAGSDVAEQLGILVGGVVLNATRAARVQDGRGDRVRGAQLPRRPLPLPDRTGPATDRQGLFVGDVSWDTTVVAPELPEPDEKIVVDASPRRRGRGGGQRRRRLCVRGCRRPALLERRG